MHGLRNAAGYVQSKLAGRLQTRFTPQIRFILDQGVKKSIEMTRLLNEARSQESAVKSQEAADRDQESGIRSQEAGVRDQESGSRGQGSDG
jgi:ribosome-binding factor A